MLSKSSEPEWTKVISPKVSVFDFKLKEVWQYRDLLILLVKRDFIALYKQTILGPLWHIIQPAMSTAVSLLLFNVIAGISTNGINPVLFQMSGIILWNYFSTCLLSCSSVFIKNSSIFGKVYFPRLIMPLSIVLSTIMQFFIQFGLLTICMIFYLIKDGNIYWGWSYLMIPVYLILMAGIGLGLGIIISSLTTKYRDLSVLLTFGIQLLMFGSAVNYPMSALSKKNHFIYSLLKWNPIASLIEGFRNCLLLGKFQMKDLLFPFIFMLFSLMGGIILFNRVERTFMDTV